MKKLLILIPMLLFIGLTSFSQARHPKHRHHRHMHHHVHHHTVANPRHR